MSKTHRISARCDRELHDGLAEQADSLNMSLPDYVRFIAEEALTSDRAALLKSRVVQSNKFKSKLAESNLANTRLKSIIQEFNQRGFFARLFNIKPNLNGIDLS